MNSPIAYLFTQPYPPIDHPIYSNIPSHAMMIGVDGGTNVMDRLQIKPNLIIGDMDSIQLEVLSRYEESTTILRYPTEKNETDCELAIRWCIENGISEVIILNALTGRVDHILGMLQNLLYAKQNGMKAQIVSGDQKILFLDNDYSFHEEPGTRISLIPFSSIVSGVLTYGLEYPLRGEDLFQEQSRGISNVVLQGTARIQHTSGELLLIISNSTLK